MDSGDGIQTRAASLRQEATRRWLVKDELVFLLQHYKLVGVPILHSLQLRPPSGTLLFYNTLKISDYKKDGWHWQKRKDKSGRVREDRAKLVINREVIILGTYVHSADTSTFHRRIYSVRDSNDSIVLVHYFDEVNKEPVLRQFSSTSSKSRQNTNKGVKRSLPQLSPPKPIPSEETVDSIMKNCFEMDFEPQTALYQTSSLSMSDADLLLLKDSTMDCLSADDLFKDLASPEKYTSGLSGQQTFELVEISDFSPDWDFGDGGAKILICLAAKLPKGMAQDPMKLFVQFGAKRVRAEKVSDTVLRCTAPSSLEVGGVDMFVCHCGGSQECIQLSHKKQFTYRSHYQVSPSLIGDIARDKRLYHRPNLSTFVESDLDERQCKIRVVERLSEFHHAIRTKTTEPAPKAALSLTGSSNGDGNIPPPREENASLPVTLPTSGSPTSQVQPIAQSNVKAEPPDESTSSSEISTALDDCTIETLSDNDLEQLSEKLLERVVRQLITVAHTSEELLEELNSLDETGLSLLHYVSFYNYSQLVPVLVAHGAHINQQSTQGQTALHLAAGCGHDEVVDVLLQSGADLQVRDFDGLTAADRAEKSGHAHVAAKLHRHMGDEPNDLGAVDEIYGFGGSPMEIDDAPTPYTDAGDMGLLAENDDVMSNVRPPRSHSNSCESPSESNLSSKATSYVGENQEHNRKLLLGAFSTMSLHDKCALSLTISRDSGGHVSRRRESSVGENIPINSPSSSTGTSVGFGSSPASMVGMDANLVGGRLVLAGNENDSDVQSMIAEDEEGLNKLQAAMELMGPEERQSLEDEVKVLQHGIRAWLLKRNCKNMRETTKQLREATQSIEDQQKQQEALSERERAAVTVQAATRSMLARRSFLQTRHVTIKFQAATRGVLCRKNFARMKAHALASLVIQRNVREWWNKQPAATRIDKEIDDQEKDSQEEKAPIPEDAYEAQHSL
ncbi:calmodulin-binding transcription activator, putative [Phytophthora infestans T30-4]|uniref:Calmodulin-binding transcription activator, putative n=1 Tax=Phytophthora infestans (strain T30-4) TaxID=403677 RepID=D0MQ84_PHYIT|nr:calmodulin-binding transcription activator, putative [Phytophthora infestans T30-4]EEY57653.1 calmodulin-binding transcription activator, putative [Phytophthora infestans T30-4]|eukprot:XP_002908839.1 calmodulin-binding transcription activator, putative [Phytophthora infestans T30-4]